MSVKCYTAPPDPSYYNNAYYSDVIPPYTPDYVPSQSQWEAELWPPRDYHEYLRQTYPTKGKPKLHEVPRFPHFKKQAKPVELRPQSEIINPRDWNVSDDILRDACAKAAYIVKRILNAVMVRGTSGAEDLIAQIVLAMEMIKRVVEYEKVSATIKPKAGQERLFDA